MFKANDYEEILKFNKPLFIDLRSEGEFKAGTIPGAISMPVLSNEERKVVGTLYDSGKITEAKLKGVEFFTPKLVDYYKFIAEACRDYEPILFCSRGGFRSTVLFDLLKSLGQKVYKLNLGYKGYRAYVLKCLENLGDYEYIVLKGFTGCGKTEILKELSKRGKNVLDLEGLANHRGSLFGGVGLGNQPSQKTFESEILESYRRFKKGPVFVEAESSRIGDLILPLKLKTAIATSPKKVLINDTVEGRLARIKGDYLRDYSEDTKKELMEALENLKKYISHKRYVDYLNLIKEEKFDFIIKDLMEKYYDANYAIKKDDFILSINNEDPEKSCDYLLEKLGL
ncbi:tRNA 2-selenouridine(34) synthase MnmH [Peptoniphilus catoniae]|uniref:tRNA 2-selenouridine(34) synthase MnmH n=1 Tax=Peptoniphilus catoniae TaxID=1660341 RepID=UPI0010FD34F9|nr:tRNA 2-selenouridine(34) synthase MnmH [Peptoniphilus catoniae]